MEIQDYCRSLHIELTGWKAKVYDLMQRLDRVYTGDKGKVASRVNGLHIIVEELSNRILQLETECPTDWQPVRVEIQNKLQTLSYEWEDAWNGFAGDEVWD